MGGRKTGIAVTSTARMRVGAEVGAIPWGGSRVWRPAAAPGRGSRLGALAPCARKFAPQAGAPLCIVGGSPWLASRVFLPGESGTLAGKCTAISRNQLAVHVRRMWGFGTPGQPKVAGVDRC
jgi:hypothetical protein